jgi:tetratricopeptide (TPR) repeat protein
MKKSWYYLVLLLFTVLHAGQAKERDKQMSQPSNTSAMVTTEQLYSEAYLHNPLASQMYIHKGIYRMQEGKYELAVYDFQQALRLNYGSFEAYSLLGEAMAAMDLTQEALTAFDKAIDLNPFYANAYLQRAALLQSLGNYTEAYEDYAIALYIDPSLAK